MLHVLLNPLPPLGYAVVASHSAKSGRTECAIFDVANKFAAFHHRCDPKQVTQE